MDLREKPGVVQRIHETVIRFRLIFILVAAIACGVFFAGYRVLLSTLLSFSEKFCMLLDKVSAGISGQVLALLPFIIFAVLLLALRFVFGGKRSGFSALGTLCFGIVFLFGVQGSETIVLPIFLGLGLLSLIAFILWKNALACSLFPLFLTVCALVGVSRGAVYNHIYLVSDFEILAYVLMMMADVVGVSLLAGKELSAGVSKTGALLTGMKKQIVGTLLSVLVVIGLAVWKSQNLTGMEILKHAVIGMVYVLFYFLLALPLLSFAPFARLRAGSRKLENLKGLQEKGTSSYSKK